MLIIFGAGKLPHVMGDVAKGIKNFKKGMAEDETEAKKSIEDSEAAEVKTTAASEKTEASSKQS